MMLLQCSVSTYLVVLNLLEMVHVVFGFNLEGQLVLDMYPPLSVLIYPLSNCSISMHMMSARLLEQRTACIEPDNFNWTTTLWFTNSNNFIVEHIIILISFIYLYGLLIYTHYYLSFILLIYEAKFVDAFTPE